MVFAAGERPVLAPLAVPPMQHIQEMCTPAPEVVLAEFRVQKGIADPKAQLAAAPETIAEEQAAEAEEPVLTPRSGESQCIHVGNETHAYSILFSGSQTYSVTTFRAEALAMLHQVCRQPCNGPGPHACLFPGCWQAGTERTIIVGSNTVPFALLAGMHFGKL